MTDNTLTQRIQEDMKTAMRARDKLRLGTIRMLLAAIKQREIDDRITLDNAAVITTINKMVKQRRESIKQFEAAKRQDLVDIEKLEITFLEPYLPEQLSAAAVDTAVNEAISSTGAESMKDMGKVMGLLKSQLEGQTDMSLVSRKVKEQLQ